MTQMEIAKAITKIANKNNIDMEVFPNLFVICWKKEGTKNVQAMINPSI